jgi:hypothetical protein
MRADPLERQAIPNLFQPAAAEGHEPHSCMLPGAGEPRRWLLGGHRRPDGQPDHERHPDEHEEPLERAGRAHRRPGESEPEATPLGLPELLLDWGLHAALGAAWGAPRWPSAGHRARRGRPPAGPSR